MTDAERPPLLSSGIPGLDSILHGGFAAERAYLITGRPGTGKTSLGMQFLSDGAKNGEDTVYISFSESRAEIRRVADAHGWPVDDIEVVEMAPELARRTISGSSIFHGAEVELPALVERIIDIIDERGARRLVVDSLAELRRIAETDRAYRRALFQLKVSLERSGTTTLFVGEKPQAGRTEPESIVHGIIELEMVTPVYGPVQRRLEVKKIRGRKYETGLHDFAIVTGGLRVFPRLRVAEGGRWLGVRRPLHSGVASLDRLLGGGLERGTTTLLLGPSGTGKSSIVMQYAVTAAERGEDALVYSFAEDVETIKRRADKMALSLNEHLDSGAICIRTVDASELSLGQFVHRVRQDVDRRDPAFVAMDSIDGYIHAMRDDRALVSNLRDLLAYLGGQGTVMMLVMTLKGVFGVEPNRGVNLNYLADAILYFRYFEKGGAVHKSIAALKHRTCDHEKLVRELHLGRGGVRLGEPIDGEWTRGSVDDGASETTPKGEKSRDRDESDV